ncbi:MAG TPA: hypothetical protein VEC57_10115 [Candidatus Limnocylindrales bacterium]|nr:hypothetical protein [Candidatus Limnocylindrales bacterium]
MNRRNMWTDIVISSLRRLVDASLLLTCAALPLPLSTAESAVVPTSDEIVLGMGRHSPAVVRAGDRFAVVHEQGAELPSRILLRYLEPREASASDPIEIAAAGMFPQVAAFPDGSLVVVWAHENLWYARLVDAAGEPSTEALPLEGLAGIVQIDAGSQGNWVLVSNGTGLRFNGATQISKEPFVIGNPALDMRLAVLPNDSFFVTWTEQYSDPECEEDPPHCNFDLSQTYLYGRAFDSDAVAAGEATYVALDFHDDEQGKNGHAVAENQTEGFLAAWLDYIESDYEPPGYLALRRLDEEGAPIAATRVLAEVERDATGLHVAMASDQVVIATSQDVPPNNADIEIYTTPLESGPVEKLSLPSPAKHDFVSGLASGPDGSLLVVWKRTSDQSPVHEIVARPFFASSAIVCGDADHNSTLKAADALRALHAAVGIGYCAAPVCDVNGDGDVLASDAALILATAVGIATMLDCPATGSDIPPPFDPPHW